MFSTLCDEEHFESNFQGLPFPFISSDLGHAGSSELWPDQDFSGYWGRNWEEISLQSPGGTVPGSVCKWWRSPVCPRRWFWHQFLNETVQMLLCSCGNQSGPLISFPTAFLKSCGQLTGSLLSWNCCSILVWNLTLKVLVKKKVMERKLMIPHLLRRK